MKNGVVIVLATVVICTAGSMVELSNHASISAVQHELDGYQHRDGKKEAESDIANGVPKWKVCGRISDYGVKKTILHEKLGLELDWFAGCLVSKAIERYALEYNATIRAYLISVYGEPTVYGVLGDPASSDHASSAEKANQTPEPTS